MRKKRDGKRLHEAQPVAPQCPVVGNQPRGGLRHAFARLLHCLPEVVVRVRFVDEALAAARHGDDARLVAVDQMGEDARLLCAPRHQRNGYPCAGIRQVRDALRSHRLCHAPTVAGVPGGRWRPMLPACRRMGEKLGSPCRILRKAACTQHDTAPGSQRCHASVDRHLHPLRARAVHDDAKNRRIRGDGHAQIERAPGEPRRQRIAVGEPHGAAMPEHFPAMLREPPGHVRGRLQRAGDVEEVLDLLARIEHHPTKVISRSGGLRRLISSPSSVPENGAARIDRPPGRPPGASGW